jgi:hypothetical protein
MRGYFRNFLTPFRYNLTKNSNGMLKLKNRYTKLIFFKVYEYDCKSDETTGIVREVFQ